jgi:hypothetical protein
MMFREIIDVILTIARSSYIYIYYIYFLWLYSPILGLGRLHETFRFISVTRCRTVGRTPWTGDQLVARPLLTAPGDSDDGEVGGISGFWQGKPKYSEKTCPDATLSTTNLTCQTRARTRAAVVGSQRLTASAMAWPLIYIYILRIKCKRF